MKTILIVVRDFADYKRGHRIENASVVAAILASNNATKVVVSQVPDTSQFSPTIQ